MTPIDEQAQAIINSSKLADQYGSVDIVEDRLALAIAAALRAQWQDCADALASRMAPEGVSTDDMVWKFIEECRQRAKGERL